MTRHWLREDVQNGSMIACLAFLTQFILIPIPESILPEIEAGRARISATRHDLGDPKYVFDGRDDTVWRTPSINPAEIVIELEQPKEAKGFRVKLLDANEYRIEAADSLVDLRNQAGSYRDVTGLQVCTDAGEGYVAVEPPVRAKVWRLWVKRTKGDDYVHVYEWQFATMAPAEGVRIEMIPARPEWKPSDVVPDGGVVRMRAYAFLGGASVEVTSRGRWETEGFVAWPAGGENAFRAVAAEKATLRFVAGNLTAEKSFDIKEIPSTNVRPDIDLLFIERLPKISFDASDVGNGPGWPAEGSSARWVAHIRARNNPPALIPYEWRVDGEIVERGTVTIARPNDYNVWIERPWKQAGETITLTLTPPDWDSNPHNNARTIRTNAISLGFWVEEGLANHWLSHQHKQNEKNESFEDWAQFMVELWNEMMEKAVHPGISPNGLTDRFRLDRVWVVPSGSLPLNGGLPSNNPDSSDKSVDLAWGFCVDPNATVSEYWRLRDHPRSVYENPPAFLADWALIHELHHARYVIDSYGFDVHAPSIQLEIDGSPLIGGLLPQNFARFNKYKGVMGGGIRAIIDEYVAGALERVAGKRARGGNMNSPSVIGEYLNDLPDENVLQFVLPSGAAASGATVRVWRAKPKQGDWYGKIYSGDPNMAITADESGRIALGKNPFWEGKIPHTYGHAASVLLIVVTHGGNHYVHFQEVSDFNLAYWKGARTSAEYKVTLKTLPDVSD